MPEIRKDYLLNSWVVISTERGKRPSSFIKETPPADDPAKCPFCPGKEHLTPPEVLAYRCPGGPPNSPDWWIRAIPNKFPALRIEGEVNHRVSQLHNSMNGVGAHEVLIETPEHEKHIAILPDHQVQEIINGYKDRYNDLTRDRRFKYILIFKNHGKEAGASLAHPHSQIIATPIIPRRIMGELDGANRYYESTGGMCIFDDIIATELEDKERVILETEHFVALCPYAARFPFETWIIPKQHDPVFEDMAPDEKVRLSYVLKRVLKKMYLLLDDPPYNYYIHTAPCGGNDYRFYHWHLEITPYLSTPAGFERGSGFYINPVSPEDAAKFLRETEMDGNDKPGRPDTHCRIDA